jgi:hypothetical protein
MATKLYESSRQESFEKAVNANDRDWVHAANDMDSGDSGDEHESDEDMDFDDEKNEVLVSPPRHLQSAR